MKDISLLTLIVSVGSGIVLSLAWNTVYGMLLGLALIVYGIVVYAHQFALDTNYAQAVKKTGSAEQLHNWIK
ncbi:MAG: hypothetical protein ACMXYC_01075 [Candidatus Woesearchaeota archaeon]